MALRLSTGLRNALAEQKAEAEIIAVAQTTISFGDGDGPNGGDTINDSGNGLGSAEPKKMVTIFGSTTSNGTFEILSVASNGSQIEIPAGSLPSSESAGDNVTIVMAKGGSFSDLFRNGVMKIFPGTQPADADTTEGVTELVEISLNSGTFVVGGENGINFGAAVAGVLGKASDEVWSGVATGTNTAGWFRFYDKNRTTGASTTAIRFDGAIAQSSAQLNMSNTSIVSAGTTTIDSVALTIPTA
jgi:hypothetical protein